VRTGARRQRTEDEGRRTEVRRRKLFVRHGPSSVLRPLSCGMTLLELILVMVILSTVLALAAPSLRGFFASRRIDDAAAQILVLTQWARSQAISEGVVYRLNFDTRDCTYWLTAQKAGAFEPLDTELGQVYTLPKDIELELEDIEQVDKDVFLAFSPYGTVTAGLIRLTDRSGRVLEVSCPSVTETFSIVEPRQTTYDRYVSR
jgi:prepilin-type N-terminal cleavage/methylation domain-containing protein